MILLKSIAPICLGLLIVLPGCKERQSSQSSNPQPAAPPVPNPVVASFWVNENEAMLAVVNISGETKKVRLDIPSIGKFSLVPDTVTPSLKIDGQTLSGELAPLEIATLRWN